jgi:hypothetical protein
MRGDRSVHPAPHALRDLAQLALLTACLTDALACRRFVEPPARAQDRIADPQPTVVVAVDAGWTAACGAAGQPLCPLEAWMEAELSAPLQSRDWDHLSRSLKRLAADAPAAYPRWADWTLAGLRASLVKDRAAVNASCEACHKAARDDYRRRMAGRPAPAELSFSQGDHGIDLAGPPGGQVGGQQRHDRQQ